MSSFFCLYEAVLNGHRIYVFFKNKKKSRTKCTAYLKTYVINVVR